MTGGIVIHALYTLECDHCQVAAEGGIEHRSRTEAMRARNRVAEFDGWLLRRLGPVDEFTCPECAAKLSEPGASVNTPTKGPP